jgi:hypothetical protein
MQAPTESPMPSLSIQLHNRLECPDAGVVLGCESNKSRRTCCSSVGGCISAGDTGAGRGHTGGGFTTGPLSTQPESASTQASDNPVRILFRTIKLLRV